MVKNIIFSSGEKNRKEKRKFVNQDPGLASWLHFVRDSHFTTQKPTVLNLDTRTERSPTPSRIAQSHQREREREKVNKRTQIIPRIPLSHQYSQNSKKRGQC